MSDLRTFQQRAEEVRGRAEAARASAREAVARADEVMRSLTTVPAGPRKDHAALVEELAGLREAMASRATIEQAKGIIMGSLGVDAERAFAVLVQQSQHQNRKLREVAEDLVADLTR
jgi:hypothetical protein